MAIIVVSKTLSAREIEKYEVPKSAWMTQFESELTGRAIS